MRRVGIERFICWDLDETTGSFRDYQKMGLTRGMEPLLEGLKSLGMRHVITTAAWREHAEFVLAQAGIRGIYEEIFDVHQICDKDYNKYYMKVAERLGISPEEAPGRILVVGNMVRDAPADLDLTFLYHPEGSTFDANVYMKIIARLMLLSDSWAEAHTLLEEQNAHHLPVAGFEGGQQFIEDIWVGVGRSLRNVRPEKPSDRIISIYSVPESYRSETDLIKIKEGAEPSFIQPALSLST